MKIQVVDHNDTVESVDDCVDRKLAMLRRVDEIKAEIVDVSTTMSRINGKIKELGFQLGGIPEGFDSRRDALTAERDRLREELAGISPRKEALVMELKQLQANDLPACVQKTGIADLLPHQQTITAIRVEIGRLEEAIHRQRSIIAETEAVIVPAPDQSARRADVLTRLAIGEAEQAELDELDAEIEKELSARAYRNCDASRAIKQATQTILALEGKIAEARGQLGELNNKTPHLLEQYLLSEIRDVCAQYISYALVVQECYLRIGALERIHGRVTGKSSHIMPATLSLPCPDLEGFREEAAKYDAHSLFDAIKLHHANEVYLGRVNAELTRIRGEGCMLL